MNERCPNCDYKKLKTWDEMSEDEKMIFKAKYSDFPLEQRKRHRFCPRCLFEIVENEGSA